MHKINYLLVGGLVGATAVSGAALSMSTASATGTASDAKTSTPSVTVAESCSMTATVDTAHTATLPNGTYSGSSSYYPSGIGQTTIRTLCNDSSGYAIYAVGFSGNTIGETYLRDSDLGSSYDITTGTATSGETSAWAMKLAAVSNDYAPSILNSFDSYHAVPNEYTKVASFDSGTDATTGSSLTTTYAAYIAGSQPAGTYTGKVKYTLVHPAAGDLPDVDTLQNVAYWGGSLAVGEETTATDYRNFKEYTVARVCTNYSGSDCTESELWMTQNLDLRLAPDTPLTSLNTDLNTATDNNGNTLSGYSVDGSVITWTPGSTLATPATISDFAYFSSTTTVVSGWTNSYTAPYQAEGQLNGNDVYTYTSGSTSADTIYTSLSACTAAGHTAEECAHYKNGNYYNFSAAVAMNDTSAYTTQYTVMPNSICPRGWRLPNGLTSDGSTVTMSDFNKLLLAQGVTSGTDLSGGQGTGYTSAGFTRIRSTGVNGDPLYFVRSGLVNGTTLFHSSAFGYYWSSTVQSSSNGYDLGFGFRSVNPASRDSRSNGISVRCIAR